MNKPGEHIILHFIKGMASEQELADIQAWLAESEENARELFQLEATWHRLEAQLMPETQIEQALRKVMSNNEEQHSNTKEYSVISHFPSLSVCLKYAAILLIGVLIGGGILYHLGWSAAQQNMLVAQAVDTPQHIVLPDGSHVWLNKGAQLCFPEKFSKEERQVKLEGEGYFEVTKDSKHPFVVSSDVMTVKVLGTKFNFKTQSGAEEVCLIEGSVGVQSCQSEEMVVLAPGQKAEIDHATGKLKVSEVNARLSAVWHDDLIPFENASLEDIAKTLESVYGVRVVLMDGLDRTKTYSGAIQHKKSIDTVLKLLRNTLPIDYQKSGNTIILRKP